MRSIRPQTVTLAVLAILFGLGAAWAAKQVLLAKQPPPVVQAAPVEPRAPLLILQSNLAPDERIRDKDVASIVEPLQKLKERNVPLDKALKFTQQAVGRILKVAKPGGSWLTEDDFYPLGTEPPLKLREGYRAVYLRIDDPAASSNIIQTGSMVDVILTTEHPDTQEMYSWYIARGLQVLSPPVGEGGMPTSITTVGANTTKKSYIFLEATPLQAKDLTLAQQLSGTISVALSSGGGGSVESPRFNAVVSGRDLPVGERELLGLPPREPPPGPPERIVVENWHGNKAEYVVFNADYERISEEKARDDTLPREIGTAAKPAKRCLECEKKAREAKERAKSQGGGLLPTPGEAPIPPALPKST